MLNEFPRGFAWGVATSAYQIEGGRFRDGKGESIWDRFSDEGRMTDSGDVTCDHYHRWREDIALMADLGVSAYGFSTAWTRVIPDGAGPVNEAGLEFYSRLVDELLRNGIVPWLTLYHWDLPQALQDRGGWLNRDTVDAFARYADVVSSALGDRVKHWITQNEPWVVAHLGHGTGLFAPGIADFGSALTAGHNVLLSHGRAVPVIRSNVPDAQVGISIDCWPSQPASDDPADIAACEIHDALRNKWFFDPVFGRGYPPLGMEEVERRRVFEASGLPYVEPGDMDDIAAPIDFLGVNFYTSIRVSAQDEPGVDSATARVSGSEYTDMGWEVTPSALTDLLVHLNSEYSAPAIVITENGASYSDGPDGNGSIHDDRRIAYIESHIDAMEAAMASGVPVRGYFTWSLLDNLEWVSGFAQRFGLVWVDHPTGKRIPKDSYYWYRSRIRSTTT